jgi:cytochrome c oxidase subunit 2
MSNARLITLALCLVTIASLLATVAFAHNMKAQQDQHPAELATVADVPPFDRPGVRKLPDGSYEVYIAMDGFRFTPSAITVPAGSKVTFFVTSRDIVRGFAIAETDVNMMAGPGWVTPASRTFDKADRYLLVCYENCGIWHEGMYAIITVK